MSDRWAVEHLIGSAAELHHRPLGPDIRRTVGVLSVPRPALVLGSTQRDADADPVALDARGVELTRRRSGGGAVLLTPGQTLWLDVDLPRADPLWDDDVGRATHWLGRSWTDAVADLGLRARVHTDRMVTTSWSRSICFAGIGPGEVLVRGTERHRKLVGIAQRRTRAGTRFQCVVHRAWDPGPILDLLALEESRRIAARVDLETVGIGLDIDATIVVDALLRHLP